MNVKQLRQSIKVQWLSYYRENRDWITRVGVWVSCEGQRRPSSSFILATLAVLEPKLTQLLPLIVELSSNPDRIVIALGLNFNPDDELENLKELDEASEYVRMLPSGAAAIAMPVERVVADAVIPEPVIPESVMPEPVIPEPILPVPQVPVPQVNHSSPPSTRPVEARVEPRVKPRTESKPVESKSTDRDRNHHTNAPKAPSLNPSNAIAPPPSTRGVGFKPSAKPASQPAPTKFVQRPPMDTEELGLDELPNRDPIDEPLP